MNFTANPCRWLKNHPNRQKTDLLARRSLSFALNDLAAAPTLARVAFSALRLAATVFEADVMQSMVL